MKSFFTHIYIALGFFSAACHCVEKENIDAPNLDKNIEFVASSTQRWTGVAVSSTGRLFASYPNVSDDHTYSVVELIDSTSVKPYPSLAWNSNFDEAKSDDRFIAVQSLVIDENDFLWVLDAGNVQRNAAYQGVINGGAKLVKIDLHTNTVVQKIVLAAPVVKSLSYLNDIRIDENKWAYITDSNEGALIVVNLATGDARRILGNDPRTKSENRIIIVDNQPYRDQNGKYPEVHASGIALTPDKTELYWRPLTGTSLYKINTSWLQQSYSDEEIGRNIVTLASYLPPSDGMIFAPDGKLYFTSPEDHGIRVYDKDHGSRLIKKSDDFQWPDSFSISPDGYLYVTTSQRNIVHPTLPYRILRFRIL